MSRFFIVFPAMVILAVTGCASMPNGPSVMVLPGTGMSFDQFRNDNAMCQQFAFSEVGGTTANQAGINSGVPSALVGTALGAAAGAAFGGASGAGSGLLACSLVCTGTASSSMYANQQRYDAAFIQCMYTKGNQVPVSGQFSTAAPLQTPMPPSNIPPPPPGSPPPAPTN
jgi:hypothetical protein